MKLSLNTKRLLLIILLLVILLSGYFILLNLTRVGKTKFEFVVAPSTAVVSIDDKTVSSPVYLSKGRHTIKATLEDFTTVSKPVDVGDTSTSISLLLKPANDAGENTLKNNPQLQLEREAIGSDEYTQNSDKIRDKYPFLDRLPVLNRSFVISQGSTEFSVVKEGDAAIALYVKSSGPLDRQNAVDRIRTELGIDPTTIEILFEDTLNPFLKESE